MSWVRADKDGLLDHCACCGGIAGWRPDGNHEKWAASCTDCTNQTGFFPAKYDALTVWNQAQRATRLARGRRRHWPRGIRRRLQISATMAAGAVIFTALGLFLVFPLFVFGAMRNLLRAERQAK